MKKLRQVLRYLGFGLLFGFTLILVLLLNFVFSTPKIALQDLPPNLISHESEIGQKLLAESNFRADYPSLEKNFVSQSRRAFCGVASSVTALNSLRDSQPPVTQATVFNKKARKVIHPLRVTFGGMTVGQLEGILQANQLDTELIYAADIDLEQFRLLVQENLSNPDDVMLVNYRRPALDQPGGGHISPIAAYHSKSDRILILDVAAYKYPATWVSTEELWKGINSLDQTSNLSRGLITVRG
ncbi:MAG: phytochelatin synthase family protein [Cyanobacteria bacterium J06598_4]